MLTENRVGSVRQIGVIGDKNLFIISVSFFSTEYRINIMMDSCLQGEVKEIKTDSN